MHNLNDNFVMKASSIGLVKCGICKHNLHKKVSMHIALIQSIDIPEFKVTLHEQEIPIQLNRSMCFV